MPPAESICIISEVPDLGIPETMVIMFSLRAMAYDRPLGRRSQEKIYNRNASKLLPACDRFVKIRRGPTEPHGQLTVIATLCSNRAAMAKVQDLIERFYRGVPIGQRTLESAISDALGESASAILDAGCGIDAPLTRKLGARVSVVGIDLCHGLPNDLRVVTGDLAHLPFRDGCFSLIFSRSVFEHLTDPRQVLKEFHRVLRPNGICVILTPNRFDYSSVLAALTPQRFHQWFVRKVYDPQYYDTSPAVNRANTPGFFRSVAKTTEAWKIRRISGVRPSPATLAFSRVLFRIGIGYDWLLALFRLTALQPSLLVVLQRATE